MVEADLKSYVAMAYCIYRFAGGSMSPQKVQSWIRKYGVRWHSLLVNVIYYNPRAQGIAGSDVKTSLERWYIITRFIHSVLSAWDWRLMSGRGVGRLHECANEIFCNLEVQESAMLRPVSGFGFVVNSILPDWVLGGISTILSGN